MIAKVLTLTVGGFTLIMTGIFADQIVVAAVGTGLMIQGIASWHLILPDGERGHEPKP